MQHTDNHMKAYYNSKGQRVMRVSQVIKRLAKEQIAMWANMLGFKGVSYKKELERTANIGSLCHDVLEHFVNPNRLAIIEYEAYGLDEWSIPEAKKALMSFFAWYKNNKERFKVLHTEFVVVGETLGGTIDCIIESWYNKDKVIFVDYKTSGDVYLTQYLQLAAYVMIYEEVYGKDTVDGVMILHLDKKHGRPAEGKLIRYKDLKMFMVMFKSLFEVAYCEEMLNGVYKEMIETIY